MAVTMEQEMEVLREAIMLEKDVITDDMALIQSITEEEDLDDGKKKRKALDSICINGVRITDMLKEADRDDIEKYAQAIREALSADNSSFVTVMNENYSKHKVVMPAYEYETISYDNPEEWLLSEEAMPETDRAKRKTNAALRYAADYEEAAGKAIKVTMTNDNIDLIKNVTGMDVQTPEGMRKALDSIYINGKNLTDKLGEENENDLFKYTDAIREALSPENDSFITIMNRNSVFANPRAVVIDAPEGSTPEEKADAQRKANISLHYAAGYRSDVYNTVKNATDKLKDRRRSDWRIFFKSLFPDGADLSQYQQTDQIMENTFKNIVPGFVTSRSPENLVYVYMLTMEYPPGSGEKPTIDQILTDDSREMRELKEKAGKEFCKIFQKLPPDRIVDHIRYRDDAQYYNSVALPKIMEMTDAALHMKMHYEDLSEKSSLETAVMDEFIGAIWGDITQEAGKANIGIFPSAFQGLNKEYYLSNRLHYLRSESFRDNIYDRNDVDYSVKYQVLFDSLDIHDVKKLRTSAMGIINGDQNENILKLLGAAPAMNINRDEIEKYVNGEENNVIESQRGLVDKKVAKEAAMQLEKDSDKESGDLTSRLISTGAALHELHFDKIWAIYRSRDKNGKPIDFNNVISNINNEANSEEREERINAAEKIRYDSRIQSGPECNDFDGIKYSIIGELTGCNIIDSYEGKEAITEEKLAKMYMAAVNCLQINGQTVAERFDLDEYNILDKIAAVDHKLAEILLRSMDMDNPGNEFIYKKYGNDSFKLVEVDRYASEINNNMDPYRGDDREAYDILKKQNDMRKALREEKLNAARAYADVLSGRADKETIDKYSEVFGKSNMTTPSVTMNMDDIMDMLKPATPQAPGSMLSTLTGKFSLTNPQDLENAAKKIYIGSKTLDKLYEEKYSVKYDANDAENTKKAEEILKDVFNNNLFVYGKKELQAISIRDDYDTLRSVRIDFGKLPEKPKPVELYSKSAARWHLASTVEKNKQDYKNYLSAEIKYANAKAIHDECAAYNSILEDARLKIIREERSGPTQRAMNIDQAQLTRNGGMAAQGTALTQTQPANQRQAQKNGPTVG